MRMYVVRKWHLWGRSRFLCWNITRVSLWLIYKMHFVQCMRRTRLQDLGDLNSWIIAAVKNVDALMFTGVWQKSEYRIDVCRVSRCAHIEHPHMSKKTFSVFLWL